MTITVALTCTAHGVSVWKGHVFCDGCGRIYDDGEGDFLVSRKGDGGACHECRGTKFKRMCQKCFKHFKKKHNHIPIN